MTGQSQLLLLFRKGVVFVAAVVVVLMSGCFLALVCICRLIAVCPWK